MNFVEAVKKVLNNYANFNGRARRSEYWWFTLFTMIISIVFSFFPEVIGNIVSLAFFLPGFAVFVRRLHDVGKSGWYALFFYAIFIALFGMFFYYATKIATGSSTTNMPTNMPTFLPIAGAVIAIAALVYMLVLLCTDSKPGDNEYGPNPKYGITDDELNSIGNNEETS